MVGLACVSSGAYLYDLGITRIYRYSPETHTTHGT
jgi:hypothetical protein